jgi:hypothetical protein
LGAILKKERQGLERSTASNGYVMMFGHKMARQAETFRAIDSRLHEVQEGVTHWQKPPLTYTAPIVGSRLSATT